jgi:tetratricopeptide (TPR) repeat protein
LESEKPDADAWREDLLYLAKWLPLVHGNLFHTMTREQFDNAVKSLYENIPSLKRHQIIVELTRIGVMIGDGHSGIRLLWYVTATLVSEQKIGFRFYPLQLYYFKEGIFVQAAKPELRRLIGARLLKIGDKTCDEAYSAVRELVPRDNEMFIKLYAPHLLTQAEVLSALGIVEDMEKAPYLFEVEGNPELLELKPIATGPALGFALDPTWVDARGGSQTESPLWLRDPQNYFWFEYLKESKTLYVQYNAVANKPNETVADFFKRVFEFAESNEVDKFVLDLRHNGGGDNFLNRPIIHGLIKSNKLNQKGKLFAVIGRATFSAAQNLVNELEKHTNVIFVGEPTGGRPNHYGDAARIVLPNSGITFYASTLWWQDMDPRDDRPWIGPHVAVELTSEDYRTNNDPALNAILKFSPSRPLSESMLEALMSNDRELAAERYREFKLDPVNAYAYTERDINNLGFRLVYMERPEDVILIFQLNLESYPQSVTALNGLALAQERLGNRELAIESYRKSLELNQKNPMALQALQRLKGI